MRQFLRLIVVFLIIILGFSFEKPVSKHCNPKYISPHEVIVANLLKGDRTIKIFLDDSFEERDRLIFIDTLKRFNAFGLKVFLVSSRKDFHHIDITNMQNLGRDIIGLYPVGSNQIYINVIDISTDLQLQAVFLHEIAHWIGLDHVCLEMQNANQQTCSPVGRGFAIMNPSTGSNPEVFFSHLDILEFKRLERALIH